MSASGRWWRRAGLAARAREAVRPVSFLRIDTAPAAAGWYLAATLAMTWPLARGLTRDIPPDLGDPLLVCWILAWSASHLLRFLSGDPTAFQGFWQGNIFHPEPLTFAMSEHLFAQAVQILPVYAVTGDLILSYNLLFLSTFVLSSLGMYLLVRELTGSARPGFVAGLLFGFAPYRMGQLSHLQVLSAQWMPFALYGLRRYFESGRSRALAGAVVALIAQNLSNAYFLLFFSPVAAAYVLFELADRGRLGDRRTWAALLAAGTAVGGATLPFVIPYMKLLSLGVEPRSLGEVERFAADVYSYLTAPASVRLWGESMRVFPRPEGELFPGLVTASLAALGAMVVAGRAWVCGTGARPLRRAGRRRTRLAAGVALLGALLLVHVVFLLAGGGRLFMLGGRVLELPRVAWTAPALLGTAVALLALCPRARAWVRGVPGSSAGFYAAVALVAAILSLGPTIRAMGVPVGTGPYLWLYEYMPGFSGLRVPARLAMLVVLSLAVLAGYGARWLERRGRAGAWLLGALGVVALLESTPVPMDLNVRSRSEGHPPVHRVQSGDLAPPIYAYVRTLPVEAVLVEFPFGVPAYEVRHMFYSTSHWRRLLNGYSGYFPASYQLRQRVFRHIRDAPDFAWAVLAESGATHAIVHEGAYVPDERDYVSRWLIDRGARPVAAAGLARLFELPPAELR